MAYHSLNSSASDLFSTLGPSFILTTRNTLERPNLGRYLSWKINVKEEMNSEEGYSCLSTESLLSLQMIIHEIMEMNPALV